MSFSGPSRAALTPLLIVFSLFAPLFLALVPTLRFDHGLHSFLGFLGHIEGPHGSGVSALTALLGHPGVKLNGLSQCEQKETGLGLQLWTFQTRSSQAAQRRLYLLTTLKTAQNKHSLC